MPDDINGIIMHNVFFFFQIAQLGASFASSFLNFLQRGDNYSGRAKNIATPRLIQ